jgi:hypothetical protein
MKIIKFIQNNSNTNLVILGIPLRHDLVENSCVNKAIQVFNHKLKKVANSFNHVTMALGSTQPLTEMSSRKLPGGKKRPACRADNLATIYEPNVRKCGSLNLSHT